MFKHKCTRISCCTLRWFPPLFMLKASSYSSYVYVGLPKVQKCEKEKDLDGRESLFLKLAFSV